MEVKLNFIERVIMKLGDLLFTASRHLKGLVFKRYDKENIYRCRTYYPDKCVLVFKEKKQR